LSANAFVGTVPTELGVMAELSKSQNNASVCRFLMCGDTRLTKQALVSFFLSSAHLTVFDNMIASTIPPQLGRLSNLEVLDFGSNQLFGTIPTEIGGMAAMAGLSFFDNALTGQIPAQVGNLDGMELLYMDANDLTGTVPDSVCDLEFLEFWSDCSEVQCLCCTTCCDDNFGCV
jgi:Leucine-rich repeat (LRR) protein